MSPNERRWLEVEQRIRSRELSDRLLRLGVLPGSSARRARDAERLKRAEAIRRCLRASGPLGD